jgi:hypothetical protein
MCHMAKVLVQECVLGFILRDSQGPHTPTSQSTSRAQSLLAWRQIQSEIREISTGRLKIVQTHGDLVPAYKICAYLPTT